MLEPGKNNKIRRIILFNGVKFPGIDITKGYTLGYNTKSLDFHPNGVLFNKKYLIPWSNIEQLEYEKEWVNGSASEAKPNKTAKSSK